MNIVLIAGLWLDARAWDAVLQPLEDLGHRPRALTLPGQGDGATSATLDQQLAAVLAAVDATPERLVVVAHSAACSLAWMAADARPDKMASLVLIGGFPAADGEVYADLFPPQDGLMAFPGWEPFEGPDSDDLDEDTKHRIAAGAIPVPEGVTKAVVHLSDDRRYAVPTVLVCPEFTPADARAWIDAGDLPELAKATHLELVDLDSGHWPMFSTPAELARVLDEASTS